MIQTMHFLPRLLVGACAAVTLCVAVVSTQTPPPVPPQTTQVTPAQTTAPPVTPPKPSVTPPQAPPPVTTPQKPATTATTKTPAAATKVAPLVNSPNQAWVEKIIDVPLIAHATVYVPKQPAAHVVLFLSGDGHWNLGVVDMARRIAPKAIVIGVDYVALRKSHTDGAKCWQPAADLEEIARAAERALNLPEYHPPLLVGYSSGATAVYAAFGLSPSAAFPGGMSLGFCPDLPSSHQVCEADDFKPMKFDPVKWGGTVWLPKTADIKHEWYVLNGIEDKVCVSAAMHTFLDDMKGAHFIEIPHSGHGFSNQPRWAPPFDESIAKLLAGDTKIDPPPARPPLVSTAEMQRKLQALSLPLEYRWSLETPRALVVFLSGDGGWGTIDDRLSQYLSAHGVSVVGVSSLRYFWRARTPQQTSADVRRIMDILAVAHAPIFLGGFSFGAEVAPFVLQQFSEVDRRRVTGDLLVAPSATASFQISMRDWIRRPKSTPLRVADAVKKGQTPTLCLTGEAEAPADTSCDDMEGLATAVRLPGTHHFNGNYNAVGQAVLGFIDKNLRR
jgi:type IV secretory pathway VirJ component